MTFAGHSVRILVATLGMVISPSSAFAQSAPLGPTRESEARESLEARARLAEQENRPAEAFLLRSRLQRGDFQEGDRIVVTLLGSMTFNDTITVRAGKLLPLPRMDDVQLEGVLRSELTATLTNHLSKFLRDASVRATPLLRVAVLGQVQQPGFYYVGADVLLSDVLMKAGGPSANADLARTEIRRAGETIWDRASTSAAVSDGLSLDRLHLRAGDEIHVGEVRRRNWSQVLQVGATVLGLVVGVLAVR